MLSLSRRLLVFGSAMVQERLQHLVEQAIHAAQAAGELPAAELPAPAIEQPQRPEHGDFATPVALALAKPMRRPPREIAQAIVGHLPAGDLLLSVEIAGPGYMNFRLSPAWLARQVDRVLEQGARYADLQIGQGRRAQVEFVSANPTGPLTVGHGRNAVLGDTLARLLAGTDHDVEREYYFNNAGRQMKVLAESVRARYLEAIGRPADFPEDGYQGNYIRDIARGLVERHGDALVDHDGTAFRDAAEQAIFADIRATQDRLGIRFDRYFNEDSLYASGAIERVLEDLDRRQLIERREGAVWLRGERVGLEKDRVLVKSSGEPAYRLPDIAYHL